MTKRLVPAKISTKISFVYREHSYREKKNKKDGNMVATQSDKIACTSCIVSLAAILTCFVIVPMIVQKCVSIRNELQTGKDEFKVIADQIWSQLMEASKPNKFTTVQNRRLARSLPYTNVCQCSDSNPCPAGPAGPPGLPGVDGEPGMMGKPGVKGVPGEAPISFSENVTQSCRYCRPGSPGLPGQRGKLGEPGPKGRPGVNGIPGHPGYTGSRGDRGPAGQLGPPGKPGTKGYEGRPAYCHSKGVQGTPGYKGVDGAAGPYGALGPAGKPGPDGPAGPAGPIGKEGPKGQQGEPGAHGRQGVPGEDAQYCSCPTRLLYKNIV